jgi:hypothetical protein
MGDRPTGAPRPARKPVSQSPVPAPASPQPVAHETTARVAPPKAPLPNLFWGALGCVSVLSVGFTILFLVARPGAAGTLPAPVPLPPTAAATPAAPPPRGASPDIQPLAPPVAPPAPHGVPADAPVAHPKPAVHPIKVARAPSGSEGSGAANVKKKGQKAAGDDQSDDSSDDSAPKKKASDSSGASADQGAADSDQPVPRHRERASDEPDPEDE